MVKLYVNKPKIQSSEVTEHSANHSSSTEFLSYQTDHQNLNVIKVYSRFSEYDWKAKEFSSAAKLLLSEKFPPLKLTEVRTLKTYYLNNLYSEKTYHDFAKQLLVDPILESYILNGFLVSENISENKEEVYLDNFHFAVEIGYHPGVVDNEARTLLAAIKDYAQSKPEIKGGFQKDTLAGSGAVYLLKFSEEIDAEQVKILFEELLINPLIERIKVYSLKKSTDLNSHIHFKNCKSFFSDFFKEFALGKSLLDTNTEVKKYYEAVDIISLKGDQAALEKLSKEKLLYLSNEELGAVISYYEDEEVITRRAQKNLPPMPTDVELEVIAQTWSEHCKHKIFAAEISYHENGVFKQKINSLYKTYIKEVTYTLRKTNPKLLSVFSDNSGVFAFDDKYSICMKVETHNSPSSLDPFGGAITGIVGVNRDIIGTGIGAKPLFNTDVFCFGYPNYSGKVPEKLFHPKRIMKGVHKGVEQGGNHSGIPTVNGAMVYDDRFMGKPLVFCGTGGALPIKITHQHQEVNSVDKQIEPGDLIVMVGGRIGKDGIHGATFSSVALDDTLPSSVVQIGDPIIQKKMLDFLMVARDELLYRTLTDNGAGGLSSSVGEMATISDGCDIHLDKALLKYPKLAPWEILVSESQERMSLAVPPQGVERLQELADLYDVEICLIGEFNNSGFFTARYNEQVVAELNLKFLHEGCPQLKLKADWVKPNHSSPEHNEIKSLDVGKLLRQVLARPNIASKEKWVRQYDHEVKALTILKPFDGAGRDAPMDASVLKPFHHSNQGLVVANGLCPRLSDIDSAVMAEIAVDEALRNAVAVGANPDTIYALDNFCWPDPIDSPKNPGGVYKLAQLVRANQSLHKICHAYHLPLISGKDSMKNDYGYGKEKISVPPTLLVTLLSVIPDYERICSANFKHIGDRIYLVGNICGNLGGSEFFAELGYVGNTPPKVTPAINFKLYQGIYQTIQSNLLKSCHDISDGGLAVAVVESAFGLPSNLGVNLHINNIGGENLLTAEKLFAESAGCFVVSIAPNSELEFTTLMKDFSKDIYLIGEVISNGQDNQGVGGRITVQDLQGGQVSTVIDESINELREIWKSPLSFD